MKSLCLASLSAAAIFAQGHSSPRAGAAIHARSSDSAVSTTLVSTGSQHRAFPRIVVGNGWETTVLLFNSGSAAITFQQVFLADDSKPLSLVVTDSSGNTLTTSAIQAVVTPNSRLTVSLSAPDSRIREGWSLLVFDGGQGHLDGYVVLRRRGLVVGPASEVTLRLSDMQDVIHYVPFDNTDGYRSQLTMINPASNVAASVRITCFGSQGSIMLMDALTINPSQQVTLSLPDTYPDLANKTGTVLIEANTDRFAVSGLRYNGAYGTIAPLPTISTTATP